MLRSQLLVFLLVLACCLRPLAAQCATEWASGGPQPELSGNGRCTTLWDPDGAGPLPLQLVVGGDSLAGGLAAQQQVMTFDGTQWQTLGPGPETGPGFGVVRKLVTWNGQLVAGGSFASLGNIAVWNGSAWLPLGSGVPFLVTALTVWNGNLVAAGRTGSGTTSFASVQAWNGVAWTSLPTPPVLESALDAVVYQGQLCVAGSRTGTGPIPLVVGVLERWNGSAWLPSITTGGIGQFRCMTVRPSAMFGAPDTLYVGGSFSSIGGTSANCIAATSGGTTFAWSAIGTGLSSTCISLIARNSGLTGVTLVAVTTSTTTPVMRYAGSWVAMGTTPLTALAYSSGTYYAASEVFGEAAGFSWNGTAWAPIRGPGFVGEVRALAPIGNDMVVGGVFATISGATMNGIARWDGATFAPLAQGLVGGSVDALLAQPNGDIVAGGQFLGAGFGSACIARWNGSAWSGFGTGINGPVLALCRMPNGDLIAGGTFTIAGGVACSGIARWNGAAWSPLGSGMDGNVRALAVRGDGILLAAGTFTTAGGVACSRIAQWNGSSWFPLGAGCNNTVHGLAVRPNGDVVAVGEFTSAGGIAVDRCARWTGLGWASMGAASNGLAAVRAVCVLPNGDVLAGRGFHEPTATVDSGVSRWNGTTWSSVSGGLGPFQPESEVAVQAFALRANGELVVGGDLGTAGGIVSRNLAVLSSTCPATALSYGTGCSSAAGPLVITADTLPWIGASFRTTTTGVAANSLCLGAIGFTQLAIPLSALLVEGQPGCTLLATPDIAFVLTNGPGLGTAQSSLALANAPSLIGASFFQQTIPLEFDLSGALTAVRGSNALAATIGTL